MKFNKIYIIPILGISLFSLSCEELDPVRDIENPNLLLENVIGSPSSTASWLVGQERQLAITFNGLLDIAELGSDNYVNTQTFFNQQFDGLDISFQDPDVNTAQFRIADLRESATQGIELIYPADPDATESQLAELYFFRGFAKLLAGEYFTALPSEGGGQPVSPTVNLQGAIEDLSEAESLDPTNAGYKIVLARAHYALGDQVNAVLKANEALVIDPDFTRQTDFDGSNGPDNDFADALFDRGNFDDLQPLPRLDFLDPKYFVVGDDESPVYYVKAEEAHLILAEADLADGNIAMAQDDMENLLTLVAARETVLLNDAVEDRENRPDTTDFRVRASSVDSLRSGLVLYRAEGSLPGDDGDVRIPIISGTSVTSEIVQAVIDIDQAVELLYLLRQEIFIAEGRRFTDLGLRMPVSEVEQLSNELVNSSDIEPVIPPFVPTNMDAFSIDDLTREVTIEVNMNAVLSANRANPAIAPFFD